jgi:hypothetical protein
MSMILILIEIKFDIDINDDELLIIILEHNKKENRDYSKFNIWEIIEIGIWGIFWNSLDDHPWTIPKIILEKTLLFHFILNNYFLFLLTFLITISHLS